MIVQAKFGLNWPSGSRGEYFFKSLQTDDGRQVMAIAHTANCSVGISKKIQKNPLEYIAIRFDTYVIFFQNYG
jgi:hypothetical protein